VTGLALMLGDHIFAPQAIDHMLEKNAGKDDPESSEIVTNEI
jgi:hypothetical protein